mmetsp:Transcript_10747/g.30217  ORF Transcript_10747/g.30217 Transcript_10747/m.30217 type:complete len:251 (+) Transcript_10747:151-903(+)
MQSFTYRPNFVATLLFLSFAGSLLRRCDALVGPVGRGLILRSNGEYSRSHFKYPGIKANAIILQRRRRTPSMQQEAMYMTTNNDDNNDGDTKADAEGNGEAPSFLSRLLYIESIRLLLGDLITILLTCQLLGLADAIGVEGLEGFLLPVTMPTTLGTLVQRDAAISLAWVLAALKNESYLVASISTDEALIKSVLETFVDYCVLRVGGALALAFAMHQPVDGAELLRQCWFTLLMLGSFRYLYAKNTIIY